ncbi:MAG: ATP-binding cassette domain-containing protein [Candidatus Marinamargulisbacteria bacterium]
MLGTVNLGISFGKKKLFENVSVEFSPGNCYGLIGANGAGKSTLLKILAGDLDSTEGHVAKDKKTTISTLKQNQFEFDEFTVLDTLMMGDVALYECYAERNRIYALPDMSEEDGMKVAQYEADYSDMDGYEKEAKAGSVLNELGIPTECHEQKMSQLDANQKLKVLLGQALFGNPDVLLLDEPTNQLDYQTALWLEDKIINYENTVIVVSHDRHFLNKVCTHIADVDFGQVKIYPGNYDFWKQSSELSRRQHEEKNKKSEQKIKELEDFVRRFSANASKSKQATSRKKLIDQLTPEELPESKRRTPFIQFKPNRKCGNKIVDVKNVSHAIDGETVLNNVSFTIENGNKVALTGSHSLSKTTLLQILAGDITPDQGTVRWGETTTHTYFPKDNTAFFDTDDNLIEWLQKYNEAMDLQTLRGYLGRMLFSGDDALKSVNVLSGGEKARAMFARMMLLEGNVLLFDEPTDHLDLEAISSLNDGFIQFPEVMMFTTNDFELLTTVPNRIIEVSPKGHVDYCGEFEDFVKHETYQKKVALLR